MFGSDLYEQSVGDKGINTTNFNRLVRAVKMLLNINWSDNVHVVDSGNSRSINVTQKDLYPKKAFGTPATTGRNCTVYAGTWFLASGNVEVAEDIIQLTGSPVYVYTYCKKNGSAAGITHANTKPATGGGDEHIQLLATYSSVDTVTWTRTFLNYDGDCYRDPPTA